MTDLKIINIPAVKQDKTKKRITPAGNSTLKPLLALDYTMKTVNKNKHSASSANPFSEASNGSSLQNVGNKWENPKRQTV